MLCLLHLDLIPYLFKCFFGWPLVFGKRFRSHTIIGVHLSVRSDFRCNLVGLSSFQFCVWNFFDGLRVINVNSIGLGRVMFKFRFVGTIVTSLHTMLDLFVSVSPFNVS